MQHQVTFSDLMAEETRPFDEIRDRLAELAFPRMLQKSLACGWQHMSSWVEYLTESELTELAEARRLYLHR